MYRLELNKEESERKICLHVFIFVIGGKFCHPVLISLAVVNKEIKYYAI